MCLDKSHRYPRIAKEDIQVIKVFVQIGSETLSPNMGFKYKLNKVYKQGILWPLLNILRVQINRGFHAYSKDRYCLVRERVDYARYIDDYRKFFICIVPKGSYYFVDDNRGEIVSNRIVVSELIISENYDNFIVDTSKNGGIISSESIKFKE
jgi:hypothetical protein